MNEGKPMNLEELEEAWARLGQRVDSDFARMEAIINALAEDRGRTLVRRAIFLPTIELIATAVGAILAIVGLFQQGSAVFYGCLVGVLAFFGVLIVSAIWQIATLAGTDPAAPVVDTQRRLGRVRALRILETKWTLLLSPVLWAPFLVVIVELTAKLAFGAEDPVFSAGFVLVNVLIGCILAAALFWFSRWLAGRLQGSSFLCELLDDFAGRRLTAARDFLARLDGFERE